MQISEVPINVSLRLYRYLSGSANIWGAYKSIFAAVQISERVCRYLRCLQKYLCCCTDILVGLQISEVPIKVPVRLYRYLSGSAEIWGVYKICLRLYRYLSGAADIWGAYKSTFAAVQISERVCRFLSTAAWKRIIKTGGKAPRLPLSALDVDEIDSKAPSALPPQPKAQRLRASEACTNCPAARRFGPCPLSVPTGIVFWLKVPGLLSQRNDRGSCLCRGKASSQLYRHQTALPSMWQAQREACELQLQNFRAEECVELCLHFSPRHSDCCSTN